MKQDSEEQNTDDVGRLIRYAGEREQVGAERIENARDRVGAHWQSIVTSRRARQRQVRRNYYALAASVVVAIGIVLTLLRPEPGPVMVQVASVDRVAGDVLVNGGTVAAGHQIEADAIVETGVGGRLALRLLSGQSLRVDSGSRLVAQSETVFALQSGRAYFDSNLVDAADPVYIDTPFGRATDVGTQYMVSVTSGFLTVGVREGEVRLDRDNEPEVAIHDGSLLQLDRQGGTRRSDLASTDPMWDWVASVTPEFDIDGVSLRVYLEWYARERGLQLAWADKQAQAYADRTALDGSIKGLSLDDGLEVVRQIAPFRYEISGATMVISKD